MTVSSSNTNKIYFSLHSVITSCIVFMVCINFYYILPPIQSLLGEIGKGVPTIIELHYDVQNYLWPGIGILLAIIVLLKDKLGSDSFSFKFDVILSIFGLMNLNILLIGIYLFFIEIIANIG